MKLIPRDKSPENFRTSSPHMHEGCDLGGHAFEYRDVAV
jgi:hypothetical protein